MTINSHLQLIISTYRMYVSFISEGERAPFRKEYYRLVRDSPPDRHPETIADQALSSLAVARDPNEYRLDRDLLDIKIDSP